ncbi:ArnT family glycosyltransferase [Methanobacterium aggregans]|uniref:ArnT family glycosyltransferase n=1 Tax=Methanobacterium aggregans TaxID=1615586 RepID=UPI001AE4A4AA|nr:glycosyltransferase family 39 protein [Methanobacterium aggregans]MBP2045700.1 hypothetical protein [Methanobacterium aggregans]
MKRFDSMKENNIDFFAAILITILVLLTRLPFISKYLYEWDSVNFALSFEHYSTALQQPQAPGYILYVGLGRLVNSVINDANSTMIIISIVFSILTILMVYFFAKQIFSPKIAIVGSLILIFSPIFWFYGEIATIYPVESFMAILVVYTSYNVLKGRKNFIYISALVLGIAGGFREDLILFMLPLWIYCVLSYTKNLKKLLGTASIFFASILVWAAPTVILAGGLKAYMSSSSSIKDSFSTTSILFGAPLKNQLIMDSMLLSWLILGLGIVIVVAVIFFLFKNWKPLLLKSSTFKKPKFIFFILWIVPALLFQILIHAPKPGYILIFLPALSMLSGYILVSISKGLSKKFDLTPNSVLTCILLISIVLNCFYFIYPYNFNAEETWETPVNQMTQVQQIKLGFDMLAVYNYPKIHINDENMDMHLKTIQEISDYEPNNTVIVIRDITREDQGFSWRKAMYYLPEYYTCYLLDQENSEFKSSKLSQNVSISYGQNHQPGGSVNQTIQIPLDNSKKHIVWIMSDKSEFFREVQSKIGVESIELPNGLKIYYSNIENKSLNIEIGGFIFKTEDK